MIYNQHGWEICQSYNIKNMQNEPFEIMKHNDWENRILVKKLTAMTIFPFPHNRH